MKVVIYWQKKSTAHHRLRIRDRFRLPEGMTINGERPADVNPKNMKEPQNLEEMGYIKLRNK